MKEKSEQGRAGSLVAKHTICNHEIVGSTPTPPANIALQVAPEENFAGTQISTYICKKTI